MHTDRGKYSKYHVTILLHSPGWTHFYPTPSWVSSHPITSSLLPQRGHLQQDGVRLDDQLYHWLSCSSALGKWGLKVQHTPRSGECQVTLVLHNHVIMWMSGGFVDSLLHDHVSLLHDHMSFMCYSLLMLCLFLTCMCIDSWYFTKNYHWFQGHCTTGMM